MRPLVFLLSVCWLSPPDVKAEPDGGATSGKAQPGSEMWPWGEAVRGLQCRVIPSVDTYWPGEEMLFAIQFRNAGDTELLLNLAQLWRRPLAFYVPEKGPGPDTWSGAYSGRHPVLPQHHRRLALKPNEVVAFSRRVRPYFSGREWQFSSLYGPFGRERIGAWSAGKDKTGGEFRARFSYVVSRKATEAADSQGAAEAWWGRAHSPPVRVAIAGKPLRYGAHEEGKNPAQWRGEIAAKLRTGLVPLERRVASGRPCWFRLLCDNQDSSNPRMYAAPVGLLNKGGLLVTRSSGEPVPRRAERREEPDGAAPLQMIRPGKSVVLCDFDLASAYDLSRPGSYRVQFLPTGGNDESEVRLPASNMVEIEVVDSVPAAESRTPRRTEFTVEGTVQDADGQGAPGAEILLGEWDGQSLRVPAHLKDADGIRSGRAGGGGEFAFERVRPGNYWLVARRDGHGSGLAQFRFARRPPRRTVLKLLPGEVRGGNRTAAGGSQGASVTRWPRQI